MTALGPWRARLILLAAGIGSLALLVGVATHGVRLYDPGAVVDAFVIFLAGAVGYLWASQFGPLGVILAALSGGAVIFGIGTTAVLVLTLLTALADAFLLFRFLRLSAPPDPALGIATGLAVMVGLLQVLMHLPVNWAPAYLIAAGVVIALTRRELAACLTRLRTAELPLQGAVGTAAGAVLFGGLLAASAYGIGPETGYDALSNHLLVISWVGWNGSFHFDPTLFDRGLMPRGAGWLATWSFVLGGETAYRLLNVACLWLIAAIVMGFAAERPQRDEAPPAVAALGLIALVSTSMVVALVSQFYEEPVTTLFVTTSVVFLFRSWRNPADSTALKLTFLLLGAACASKVQALFFGGVGLAAIIGQVVGMGWRMGLRRSVIGALFFAAIGPVPYLYAFALTGNPFYPFAFGVPFDPAFVGKFSADILYRMVFETSRYFEARDGAFGFDPLLLYPVALVGGLVARRSGERAVALALLLFVIAMLSQAQYARYQVYVLPSLVLLLPVAWGEAGRLGRIVIVGGLAVGILLNGLAYRASPSPTFKLRKLLQPVRFATAVPEERMVVDAINAMYGPNAVVYFAGLPFRADLIGTGITVYSDIRSEIDSAKSVDEVGRILASHGVTHIVTATPANGNRLPHPVPPVLEKFLAERMVDIPLQLPTVRLYAFPVRARTVMHGH